MDDLAVEESTEPDTRTGGLWLGAGVIAGAAVTLAIVLGGLALLESEPASAMPPPHYVDETTAAGILHTYDGEFEHFVGGGVAVFDCNADGLPDLYFAGGSNPAALYRNESGIGGGLRFDPVNAAATDLTGVAGAYPIDIDADGLVDLAVLRVGENVMLRGTGDCGFERVNETWGIEGGADWTAAFSAIWEPDANRPTLVFGNYLELPADDVNERHCADHTLIRPTGSGYGPPTSLRPGYCTLSILFSDWNRSGEPDLRMTNDRHYHIVGEDQLWNMAAEPIPRPYTHEEGWKQMIIWGMGIASHDLTGDGLPEVFLTSQGDNKLQTLADGSKTPTYTDMALQAGATATRPYAGDTTLPSTAWHAEFQDANNDGYIDLYISKGNVEAMTEYASDDPNNLLLGTPDGTFVEAADEAGITSFTRARGAALVDLNLDGMLELVEVNRRENVTLWRNVGWGDAGQAKPMGNWGAVSLQQPGVNRNGIGSWIEVRTGAGTIEREVTIGGGHAGGQLGWIHFGLGGSDTAEIRVQWPDGELGPWLALDANTFAVIERGAAEAVPWQP